MRSFYERNFLWIDLCLAAVLGLAVFFLRERWAMENAIRTVLTGNRGAVYGTLASIVGALLGFVITTVSVLIALWPHRALKMVRESDQAATFWAVLISAMKWLGAATGAALIALLFDRDTAPKFWLFCIVLTVIAMSVLRLGRTIWILENVIRLMQKPSASRSSGV